MKKHANVTGSATAALVLAFGFPSVAIAGGVEAGSLIENTAQATYDTADGPQTVNSNTVVIKVDELLDVTVASQDSGPVATRPGTEVLTFEVTNTGNGPEAFTLTADPAVTGNDFDAVVDSIAVDTNGNGVYDDGIDEILTGPETTDVLDPDASVTVFVLVTVPSGAADTEESEVQLNAEAVTGTGAPGTSFAGAGEDGSNAIVGSSGAQANDTGALLVGITTVTLDKSATVSDQFGGTSPVPGATITYTISAIVEGSGSVDDLVVTDVIPAGTTYVTSSLALDGGALTDASGDDAGEASAVGISVDLGSVSAGTTQNITFNVKIDE